MHLRVLHIACFIFGVLGFSLQDAQAQLQQLPTPLPDPSTQERARLLGIERLQSDSLTVELLQLPFWDDFSSGKIDSTRWEARGATHSFSVGIRPPSTGQVLLDGTDERGRPYGLLAIEQGQGDRLTSKPIDLSAIPEGWEESVVLSFYWQAGGRAELPDTGDLLRVAFLNAAGEWIDVWEINGGNERNRELFEYAEIQVAKPFHHENFRFRFTMRGRISGPFDSWIIDYIFLDQGRTLGNRSFEDRSIHTRPGSPLRPYTALPWFEVDAYVANNTPNPISLGFSNLSSRPIAMEFSVAIQGEEATENVNQNSPINPVTLAFEKRNLLSATPSALPEVTRPGSWQVKSRILADDGIYVREFNGVGQPFPAIDFRINDSSSVRLPLEDFYAYDFGNVDYSAGINQREGMLAVTFESTQPVFITKLSVNFTNFAQVGRGVDILIWDDLENPPIYVKEAIIPEKDKLADFGTFSIDENVQVNGTFYVGFMQFTNDFIHVGLDTREDAGERILFNIGGGWQPNTEVRGALLIRPHVSLDPPFRLQDEEEPASEVRIFPNPVVHSLRVEAQDVDIVAVFDPVGRQVSVPVTEDSMGKMLNFTGMRSGIYLLRYAKNGKTYSTRVLVQ
ncbi:MAG: T9SS type A sorting domain-containing protein [Nitritalea sp.]